MNWNFPVSFCKFFSYFKATPWLGARVLQRCVSFLCQTIHVAAPVLQTKILLVPLNSLDPVCQFFDEHCTFFRAYSGRDVTLKDIHLWEDWRGFQSKQRPVQLHIWGESQRVWVLLRYQEVWPREPLVFLGPALNSSLNSLCDL